VVALCLGALGIACTANPRPSPDAGADVVKPEATQAVTDASVVATTPAGPVTAPVQAEPTAPVVAPTPVLTAPVAAQPGADAVPGAAPIATLPPPVAAADVERLAPAWALVTKPDKEVELETLAGGVLARIGGVFHELGPDGALVEKLTADPANHRKLAHYDIEGVWPDDVWWVKETMHERDGSDLAFFKWRANSRWVAQSDGDTGTAKWDSYALAMQRWSPRGGFLLVEDNNNGGVASFTRLAGKHPAPEPMAFGTSNLREVFESTGGTLFLFTEATEEGRSGSYDILRSCKPGEAPGCERTGGLTLPPVGGNDGYLVGVMAARNRWSMTAAINAAHESGNRESRYLVHYETGGWRVDAVPGDLEVRQLLAAPDGGLWMVLGESPQSLWHRSDAGKWVAVDLPADLVGAEKIQVALRDSTHVWVAGNVGENHAIYGAPAALQSPAVAVPSPAG